MQMTIDENEMLGVGVAVLMSFRGSMAGRKDVQQDIINQVKRFVESLPKEPNSVKVGTNDEAPFIKDDLYKSLQEMISKAVLLRCKNIILTADKNEGSRLVFKYRDKYVFEERHSYAWGHALALIAFDKMQQKKTPKSIQLLNNEKKGKYYGSEYFKLKNTFVVKTLDFIKSLPSYLKEFSKKVSDIFSKPLEFNPDVMQSFTDGGVMLQQVIKDHGPISDEFLGMSFTVSTIPTGVGFVVNYPGLKSRGL